MNRLALLIFIIYSFFPWFGSPKFDMQPLYIGVVVFTFLVIFYNEPLSVENIGMLLVTMITLLVISFFAHDIALLVRGISSYISIVLIICLSKFMASKYPISQKLLVLINTVWLVVAVLQIWEPGVVSNFVAYRTTLNRGLPSLAPEPSFFSLILIFLIAFHILQLKIQPKALMSKVFILLNIMAILFLAKSVIGLLMLIYAAFLFMAFKASLRALATSIAISIGLLVTLYYQPESRLAVFSSIFFDDPTLFFLIDQSANERWLSLVLPIMLAFQDFFIPHGFESYVDQAYSFYNESDILIKPFESNKIMSVIGSMVYEMGFVALGIIFIALHRIRLTKFNLAMILFIAPVSLFALSVTFPLFWLFFSSLETKRIVK